MFKRRKVKKYFLKNPEKVEALRKKARLFSKNVDEIIKDEDIPSIDDFISRYRDIASYFN